MMFFNMVIVDLFVRGMFVCRIFSYKGVEFEVVEVLLDVKMTVCMIIFFIGFAVMFNKNVICFN